MRETQGKAYKRFKYLRCLAIAKHFDTCPTRLSASYSTIECISLRVAGEAGRGVVPPLGFAVTISILNRLTLLLMWRYMKIILLSFLLSLEYLKRPSPFLQDINSPRAHPPLFRSLTFSIKFFPMIRSLLLVYVLSSTAYRLL